MIKSRYPAFPYIVFMAIFIIVPLIMVAYFAFTTSTGEFTMQNIIRVGDYVPVIIKSLFLAFVVVWAVTSVSEFILNIPVIASADWVEGFNGGPVYRFFRSFSPLDLLLSF